MTQTGVFGVAPKRIGKPIAAHQTAPGIPEPLLFESVTRKKALDGAALAVAILLYALGLAAGVWMTLEVGKGLAIAEYCNGTCVEARR